MLKAVNHNYGNNAKKSLTGSWLCISGNSIAAVGLRGLKSILNIYIIKILKIIQQQ